MPYRVLVTGCRRWCCRDLAGRIVDKLIARHGEVIVVHGDAPGVDAAFAVAAATEDRAARPEAHPANWEAYGRGAGPKRNQEMVDLGADLCIAVHGDLANSKGTRDCVRRALKAGIPVWAVTAEDGVPTRLESL